MPLATETVVATRLSLRMAHTTLPARTLAMPVAVHVTARLPNRELGFLSLRHMPFGPRQGGANQPSMHRAIVLAARLVLIGFRIAAGSRLGRDQVRVCFVGRRRWIDLGW
jgi:hypothetical protein